MQKYFTQQNRKMYRDRSFTGTDEEYERLLSTTCTMYVGNLPLTVTEERLWSLFSDLSIRRVIMGLNRNNRLFCGFAFVEFYSHADCASACTAAKDMVIDGQRVSVDMDYGFVDGRQWGRGFTGGSYRKDVRKKRIRPVQAGQGQRRYFDARADGRKRKVDNDRYFDQEKRRRV